MLKFDFAKTWGNLKLWDKNKMLFKLTIFKKFKENFQGSDRRFLVLIKANDRN